jgi:hypothetical protein
MSRKLLFFLESITPNFFLYSLSLSLSPYLSFLCSDPVQSFPLHAAPTPFQFALILNIVITTAIIGAIIISIVQAVEPSPSPAPAVRNRCLCVLSRLLSSIAQTTCFLFLSITCSLRPLLFPLPLSLQPTTPLCLSIDFNHHLLPFRAPPHRRGRGFQRCRLLSLC